MAVHTEPFFFILYPTPSQELCYQFDGYRALFYHSTQLSVEPSPQQKELPSGGRASSTARRMFPAGGGLPAPEECFPHLTEQSSRIQSIAMNCGGSAANHS